VRRAGWTRAVVHLAGNATADVVAALVASGSSVGRCARPSGVRRNCEERQAMRRLVEQHLTRDSDPRYALSDRAAFASKPLSHAANYLVRQSFIREGVSLHCAAVFHRLKEHEASRALPRTVSTAVLRQLDHDWRSCFAAREAWQAAPAQFVGRPCLPGYTHKHKGHNLVVCDLQALSATGLRRGELIPSPLGIRVRTQHTTVQQARIVPRTGYSVVEVVDEREPEPAARNPARSARE
jgi:putative transposase